MASGTSLKPDVIQSFVLIRGTPVLSEMASGERRNDGCRHIVFHSKWNSKKPLSLVGSQGQWVYLVVPRSHTVANNVFVVRLCRRSGRRQDAVNVAELFRL